MKRFVVVPTYNESANIVRLLDAIHAQGIPDLRIVVVDDHSPDGTAKLAEAQASRIPGLSVLDRVDDRGRGTAGIVGFDFALKLGADAIVEMDSDFSHPPSCLPALFEGLARADIVVASRLARGAVDRRPFPRRLITFFSNLYVRLFLQRRVHASRVRDWTSGYRAYRREVFERVLPATLVSRGPSILQEILYRALNMSCTAVEIPFQMQDRAAGVSTFNTRVARQSFLAVPCYRILYGGGSREFRLEEFTAVPAGPLSTRYIVSRASGSGASDRAKRAG